MIVILLTACLMVQGFMSVVLMTITRMLEDLAGPPD